MSRSHQILVHHFALSSRHQFSFLEKPARVVPGGTPLKKRRNSIGDKKSKATVDKEAELKEEKKQEARKDQKSSGKEGNVRQVKEERKPEVNSGRRNSFQQKHMNGAQSLKR